MINDRFVSELEISQDDEVIVINKIEYYSKVSEGATTVCLIWNTNTQLGKNTDGFLLSTMMATS